MKKTFTIQSGVCPKCSSQNIEYGSSDFNNNFMTYKTKCEDCKTEFIEEYTLNFNGTLIVDTNEYYDCGCEVKIKKEIK
jgi:transposase-like protein